MGVNDIELSLLRHPDSRVTVAIRASKDAQHFGTHARPRQLFRSQLELLIAVYPPGESGTPVPAISSTFDPRQSIRCGRVARMLT